MKKNCWVKRICEVLYWFATVFSFNLSGSGLGLTKFGSIILECIILGKCLEARELFGNSFKLIYV